jgi:hypothetical protein
MRRVLYIFTAVLSIAALVGLISFSFMHVNSAKASGTCITTDYSKDGGVTYLTAAVVNPTTTVTGTVNGSGCNIGVYVGSGHTATISGAEIYRVNGPNQGAYAYGVVNNGGNVTVKNSRIHQIGNTPFDGMQKGVAIYFAFESGATGTITNNIIWDYQKGGIVENGGNTTTLTVISHNTVLGQGPINYIAQNGIQVSAGSKVTITSNIVSGNAYTGAGQTASGGIILIGGACYFGGIPVTTSVQITQNIVIGNDIGFWLSNIDFDPNNPNNCVPTTKLTKDVVTKNIATNDAVTNTTGTGSSGYQAGIADQGNYDKITNNSICGAGYTYNPTPPPYIYSIDITATNNPTVTGNTSCSGNPVPPASAKPTAKRPLKDIAVSAAR